MADSGILSQVQPAFPQEMQYPLPSALASGIVQNKIRIPCITSLPSQVSASTEIRVELPELSNCFIDPATTRITFQATFEGNFSHLQDVPTQSAINAAGYDRANINLRPHEIPRGVDHQGLRPAYILGDGHNYFNRYSVWLNGNVLTDDIHNPGILSHHMTTMTSGINHQYGDWHQGGLTMRLEDKGSSIGAVLLRAKNSTNQGSPNEELYAPNQIVVYDSLGVVKPNSAAVTSTDKWRWTTNVSINMLGLMGQTNSRMIPMFIGPIRLVFYTNSLDNMFCRGASAMNCTSLQIKNFEFVANYFRVAQQPFMQILSALPSGVFLMKTGSFAYSNVVTYEGAATQQDYAITARRASNKMFLIAWQPQAQSSVSSVFSNIASGVLNDTALATKCNNGPLEGNLCSVNPNLTFFTGMYVNGESYPKQGLDPLNKPMDTYADNLTTMQMAYSLNARPAYNYQSWLVSASDMSRHTTGGNLDSTLQMWRPYSSYYKGTEKLGIDLGGGIHQYDANLAGIKDTELKDSFGRLLTIAPAAPATNKLFNLRISAQRMVTTGTATDGVVVTNDPNCTIKISETTPATAFASGLASNSAVAGTAAIHTSLYVNQDDLNELLSLVATRRAQPIRKNLLCNFCLCIDTETGKGQYMSGISTYTGSTFFRANYADALPCNGVYHIYAFHDALVAFDPNNKTVAWKI